MSDRGKPVNRPTEARPASAPNGGALAGAAIFGLAFGFLLQKGGVAKYNILIGQLLLQDFTVVKVMLSAIVVGMVGVFVLNRSGKVQLQLKPTRIAAQCIGGTIFGAGFALLAYCPGTGAAALGQGSWDALFGMAGLVAGSYIFAEASGWLKATVQTWGDKGELTVPDLVKIPRLPLALVTALALAGGLAILHYFFSR